MSAESAYAYLRVAAPELPLAEITSRMAAQPSESWQRGEPGKYNPSRRDSGWCLNSPLPRSEQSLEKHIEALLQLLEPRSTVIADLAQRFNTYVQCVKHTNTTAGLFLSAETTARLARLGLGVDLDVYLTSQP